MIHSKRLSSQYRMHVNPVRDNMPESIGSFVISVALCTPWEMVFAARS